MPSKELTAVVYLTAGGAPASYPVAVADRVRHLGRVLGAAGVVGVLATALILAGVATPAAAAPGESIASYDTRIQVSADGRMRIIETIVYDFGANSRHGLIRRIPATFRYDRTHDRVYPIDEVGVTMDGSTVPVERSAGGGYQVLKIGDPGRTVNGKHTYAIGYTVRGGLNSFADHEELYWNVIGGEWDVPIEAGRAEITGPAPVQRVACFAGPVGSRASCAEAVAEGATATVREPRLREGRATTAVSARPAPRLGSRTVAVAPSATASAQLARLPTGPAKHATRCTGAGPVISARPASIGTSHSPPITFQYSSSWSAKELSPPRTVYPMAYVCLPFTVRPGSPILRT